MSDPVPMSMTMSMIMFMSGSMSDRVHKPKSVSRSFSMPRFLPESMIYEKDHLISQKMNSGIWMNSHMRRSFGMRMSSCLGSVPGFCT